MAHFIYLPTTAHYMLLSMATIDTNWIQFDMLFYTLRRNNPNKIARL